jgi:hypothetical protein
VLAITRYPLAGRKIGMPARLPTAPEILPRISSGNSSNTISRVRIVDEDVTAGVYHTSGVPCSVACGVSNPAAAATPFRMKFTARVAALKMATSFIADVTSMSLFFEKKLCFGNWPVYTCRICTASGNPMPIGVKPAVLASTNFERSAASAA